VIATCGRSQTAALDGVAWGGMFVFGVVMALIGAVMPVLSQHIGFGLGDVGRLFLVMNGTMLVTSLVVGPAMDRLGIKAPLALGAWIVAVALWAIAGASRFADLLPAIVGLGLGGGALNAGTNTLVADLHDDPVRKAGALNVLGVFFGFGALFLPLSIGALLVHVGLAGLLLAAAALCVIIGLTAVVLPFPAAKQERGWAPSQIPQLARDPLVLALAFLLFFESGNEFVLGGYVAAFLTRELSVSIAGASYLLGVYWAVLILSRLLLGRAVRRFGANRVVVLGALAAAAGAVIIAAAPTAVVAVIGIVLTSAALAGIFPTVLGLAGTAFPTRSGTVFGILFTVGLTGGMTMPWLAGQLAESAGLRMVLALAAANFVAVATFGALAQRFNRSPSLTQDPLSR
jgi:fucose permease